ncbi:MFS general substrate transporter [Teratosphaeria nubilosa]|uniref:MFS general substrate transporter n=1 Tax=Teratosphaeria nubilosa TaxID=161662 RepID=A0A6G1LCC6_9PEZI|nr:MFS general substrate transporter [Teratosphaeria nubilosa]
MFAWLTGSPTRAPVFLEIRSSKTFIISTIAIAIFTDIFLYGIVVPVLPFALTSRSGVDPASVQTWISVFLAVYGAALLAASPFFGWLADKTESRRAPLLGGLLALAGSTVMLCVGNSIGVLAGGRVLQGISAAVVWVVGLALLVDTVGSDEVGQAMGYVGLGMSLAILLAPLLGGIVFDKAGYYAVFAMAFGLIGLDIILRLAMVERKIAVRWLPKVAPVEEQKIETHGDAGNNQFRETGDNDAPSSDSKPEAVLASDLAATEKHSEPSAAPESLEPTQPPIRHTRFPPVIYLLSSRRLLNALWASLMQASLLTAFDSILPLYVRDTFHWTSLGAGLIFLPIVVASFVGPLIGNYSDKLGPRWFATAGFVLSTPFLILLRLVHKNNLSQKVMLCAFLLLIGVGLTLVITPMMAEITYAVDAKARRRHPGFFGRNGAYAQAYSLFNMAWAGGCLVGPLLGLIRERAGWNVTVLILGILSIVTAIPTVIWTGGSIWKQRAIRKDQWFSESSENPDEEHAQEKPPEDATENSKSSG